MPLSLAYEWAETESEVTLRVRLGVAPRKGLDVFGALSRLHGWMRMHARASAAPPHSRASVCALSRALAVSDVLVKVYAPGYLLLLDLHAAVEEGGARARVAQDDVCLTLRKARGACGGLRRAVQQRGGVGAACGDARACVDSAVCG
jgi:hypothetical protein